MKFASIVSLLAASAFSVEACKCKNGGSTNVGVTQGCCASLGGNFANGNDCQAGSISEHLSNFWSCCKNAGTTSDCDCPRGCALKELETNQTEEATAPVVKREFTA